MKNTLLFAAISLAFATPALAHDTHTSHPLGSNTPSNPQAQPAPRPPSAPISQIESHRQLLRETPLMASPNEPTMTEQTMTEPPKMHSRKKREVSEQPPLKLQSRSAALQSNDCSDFVGKSGQALVDQLSQSTPECVGKLYSLKGSAATALFSEANVISVANAIATKAKDYTGGDVQHLESHIYFVRAALYVQFYSPNDVPAYSSAAKASLKSALNALFANAAIWTASDDNAGVLKEALILIDSAELGADFNHVTIKVLTDYDANWQASFAMNAAANSVFTTLFRAQWNDDMQALFARDQGILDALNNFQLEHRDLLGTNAEYLLVNSVKELSRLYYIDAMRPRVTQLVKNILSSTSKSEPSKMLWYAAAEMADYYDRSHCNDYNICGFKAQLEADTLPFNWKCSDSLKIRAQALYQDQAKWACDVLTSQESYFHSKLETGMQPVGQDNNDDLELVIFGSSSEYKSLANSIFGINTDNGGMYLEGSPAGLKNQARFIAYEAEWRTPDFHVWNLQHEYVHYLDGRYNLFGDFSRGTSANTIWWIEGLAEYISYRDANTAAIAMGETGEFMLSTIFKNNYESGQDRIYRWGYLAVRFMFEHHRDDVRQILAYLRNDQYAEYQTFMDGIGTRYDNEWQGWLASGLSTADDGIVDKGPSDVDAEPSGREGNWTGPAGTISKDYSPCQVTNEAYRYTESASLKIDVPMECIDSKLGRASFSFTNTDRSAQDLWIKIGGGWGDADIYFNSKSWASPEQNQGAGIGNGNYQVIKVQLNPDEYWHYITLSGDFGGVDMQVSTTELFADVDPDLGDGGVDPEPPANCGAVTLDYGQLTLGKNECISGGRNSFYFWVEEDNTQFTVTTKGGSGDANLYFNASQWADAENADAKSTQAGNQESLSFSANRGWRYITVDTATEFSGVTLTLNTGASNTPSPALIANACATQSPLSHGELSSGKAICTTDGRSDYYLWVPEGTSQLSINSAHGSGDVSLFSGTTWANAQHFDAASVTPANTQESITVDAPSLGWYYITVQSEPQSSGVTLQVDLR
ncbi:Microbial collagenase precursor [Shewanella baltica]|uniref:M9 family metallopeptidase n=1 Tax=Shewanella baltica TaxID=62322 RepID=UPI000F7040B1|nr:M9 family metallopeptidase [Shewanella baltica]VEF24575.1 Microbial collagenase precursor [Shewanella baltica]